MGRWRFPVAVGSLCMALSMPALAIPGNAFGQTPEFRLPPAAEPDVRLQQLRPTGPLQPLPEVQVPEAALSRAPAGADQVRFVLAGLDLEGVTAYSTETLGAVYADRIGKEISLADVYEVAAEIQRLYRKDGYFLTRIIIPPQTAREGRLTIQVIEGYVSEVKIEGEIGPVRSLVKAYLQHLVHERPLKLKTLERYLLLAKDIPGLDVQGVLRPAPGLVGAAQLVAAVERKRFDALVVAGNMGSTFTGEWEVAGSFTANSFTCLGESVTLSGLLSDPAEGFSGDNENQKVIQFGGTFRPASNGLYFGLSASYGDSNPGDIISRFDFDSKKLLVTALGGYPVIRSRDLNFSVELGFDFINSDTDIFGDLKFSRDRLRVLHLTGIADFRDAWRGNTFLSLGLRQGLPLFDASESGDDLLSRADGTGVCTSLRGELWRLQPIAGHFALFGRFAGQYAFDDLLSDEEFDVGGTRFGRGYDPKELSGDHGVGFTAELQYTRAVEVPVLERFQLFGFYDVGEAWDRGTDFSASLASAGGGVRLWLARYFSLELQVAKPLTRESDRADGSRDPQVLFRAFARF
ncbi:MAG: ShlB/FhaC/HecB family hemolysin secretion/activation protein [Deltaproteobacteria bacterium]|nr:ShlB/FhaC/HecB family hemolysin secretion/activation protein [Deltaproteobacteria bacterium]